MTVSNNSRCVIFGATGKTGGLLVQKFIALGYFVVAVGRRLEALDSIGTPKSLEKVFYDLEKNSARTPESFIKKGDLVINAAHARHTKAIISLCPADINQLITLGSARYLTMLADREGDEVRQAVALIEASHLPWSILHPTMIYGSQGEYNVQRLATLIRRFGIFPLPQGGGGVIQPIHVSDVIDAVALTAKNKDKLNKSIFIAGADVITYRDFIEAIATAIGCSVKVIFLPRIAITVLAVLTRVIPGIPVVTNEEIERLFEDKSVSIIEMDLLLNLHPKGIKDGLAQTFVVSQA